MGARDLGLGTLRVSFSASLGTWDWGLENKYLAILSHYPIPSTQSLDIAHLNSSISVG
ncbi:MAG: hypothetical protein V7K47_01710 [Nostoc sp.]